MRRLLCIFTVILLLTLCACGRQAPYWEQSTPQISALLESDTSAPAEDIRAVWIPVMQYAAWMTGQSEAQFRENVRTAFADCAALGLNTVFVHVRAYQDAYYRSEVFPAGAYLTGDYDPLAIMVEEGHAAGLAVHAWINPLRGPTAERIGQTDRRYPLRQWYEDDEKNGTYLVWVEDRFWLNPAYEEVRQLIADGVTELLTGYAVDGIHIDDYFYPTQDEAFDAEAFAQSGSGDLAAFRRANCTALVRTLYSTVKACDPDCIFSISPQGNLRTDYDILYADAAEWAGAPGCCDWIVPQIYYGFANESCPFAETLAAWEEIAVNARLVIGLAAYKTGAEDPWAGSGAREWLEDSTVLSKEAELVLRESETDGIAFYSYAALFAPEPAQADAAVSERERIRHLLQE